MDGVHDMGGMDGFGKVEVEHWVRETIDKYKFHLEPLSVEKRGMETIVSIEVAGRFPGSPITLDYHFAVANEKICSLTVDS